LFVFVLPSNGDSKSSLQLELFSEEDRGSEGGILSDRLNNKRASLHRDTLRSNLRRVGPISVCFPRGDVLGNLQGIAFSSGGELHKLVCGKL
jgi:hypothetical protein